MAAFGDADQRGRILKGDHDYRRAEEAIRSSGVMPGYLAVLSQLQVKIFLIFVETLKGLVF